MRVLVTGAGGFLGRAVARRLNEAGHAVVALVHENAAGIDGVEQRSGDIVNLDAMTQAVAGCDAVMHCAAQVTPFGRIDDYYDINVRGTDNLLAACEIAGVRKLVFTSCAGVVLDRGAGFEPFERGDVRVGRVVDVAAVDLLAGLAEEAELARFRERGEARQQRRLGPPESEQHTDTIECQDRAHVIPWRSFRSGAGGSARVPRTSPTASRRRWRRTRGA
jgi:uncharacterized protein YbjT (DUF2867 family)